MRDIHPIPELQTKVPISMMNLSSKDETYFKLVGTYTYLAYIPKRGQVGALVTNATIHFLASYYVALVEQGVRGIGVRVI